MSRSRGFTLLELVVVVAIIAIIASFAVLSIGNRALEDRLETEARRTQQVLALAADEAVIQGTELGFIQTTEGYQFVARNREGLWQPLEEAGALRGRAVQEPFYLELRIDGRRVAPMNLADEKDREKDKDHPLKPQILLLSSGEATAFTLDIHARDYGPYYSLQGDLLGRLKLDHKDGSS